MNLTPYPDYKDSHQQWLGKVPCHWEVRPSKSVFDLRNESEHSGDVHLTPSQSLGVLPQSEYMKVTGNKVVLALAGTRMKHVEVNDFVIHLRSFQGGIEWSGFRGKVSPAYTVIKPNAGVVPAYFRHCLKSRGYVEAIASLTDQLRDGQSMRYYDFGKTPLPLPPANEQRVIADFLDRETAEIDTFIADQEDLISLLGERRTATITRAVTRGLNPDVPLKESGIKWLGPVPKHWSVNAVKHLTLKITDGAHISPETDGGVFNFVSTRDISETGIDFEGSLKTSPETYLYMMRTGCQPEEGDVLFSKDGTVGRTVVVRGSRDFVVASSLIIIRPDHTRLDSTFLDLLCKSTWFQEQVRSYVKGAGLPRLSIANLMKVVGVFPPLHEQHSIAKYLCNELSIIDVAIADARQAIMLSKERRAAVISAAVTGKIDVRDFVAPTVTNRVGAEPVGVA